MPIKIDDHFTPTYIRTSSFWPSGLKLASFSLFFIGVFSCSFYIFHSFFGVMVWMHVTCPFQWVNYQWVRYIAGVRHDWLPWISWLIHLHEPFWTHAMNFTGVDNMQSDHNRFFCQKMKKKIEITRDGSEWSRNRERDSFTEPDGQNDNGLTDRLFLM